MFVPSLSPTATRTASSDNRKPQLEIGKAFNQSPLCGADTARSRGLSDSLVSNRLLSASTTGLSQLFCFRFKGLDGMTDYETADQVVNATFSWADAERVSFNIDDCKSIVE